MADVPAFLDAVAVVGAGGTVLDPDVVSQILVRSHRRNALDALTPREHEVLQLMAEGRTNSAIATALHVSVGSAEKHIASILRQARPGSRRPAATGASSRCSVISNREARILNARKDSRMTTVLHPTHSATCRVSRRPHSNPVAPHRAAAVPRRRTVASLGVTAWGVSSFRVVADSAARPATLRSVTIDTGSVPVIVRITTDPRSEYPALDMRMVNSVRAGSDPLSVAATVRRPG